MSKYALVRNNKVDEVFVDPEGKFTPEFIASLVPNVPVEVQHGWYFIEGQWLDSLPPDPITAQNVKDEVQRRMQALIGATDRTHLLELIQRGNREAIALLKKGAENWTPEESARSVELENLNAMLNAIVEAGNSLEAMEFIPTDYMDDQYWP